MVSGVCFHGTYLMEVEDADAKVGSDDGRALGVERCFERIARRAHVGVGFGIRADLFWKAVSAVAPVP